MELAPGRPPLGLLVGRQQQAPLEHAGCVARSRVELLHLTSPPGDDQPKSRRAVLELERWTTAQKARKAVGKLLRLPITATEIVDNHGDVDAKVLAIVTPGVLGPDYFREVAALFDDTPGGPPNLARIGEVMRRHGLTLAPPAAA